MLHELRCRRCNKLLGRYLDCKKLEIKCPRCGLQNNLCHGASSLIPGAKNRIYDHVAVKTEA